MASQSAKLSPRNIPDGELAFLSEYSGEKDLEKCRRRVLKIWERATSSLHVYRCVAELMFLATRVSRHPVYQQALSVVKSNPSSLWLEVGCAFGTDVRRLILDGWPANQVYCLDVHDGYWNFGLELYEDGPDAVEGKRLACPTAFGNILDYTFFSPTPDDNVPDPLPRDAFSVISVAAVLHVLAKEDSFGLLTRLFNHFLKPGGLLFGSCVGTKKPDGEHWWETPDGTGRKRFLYSEQSLSALLTKLGFEDVKVSTHERPDRAGLESRAPRVVEEGSKEAEALSQVMAYLNFSARKPV